MAFKPALSPEEFASLQEVAKGFDQGSVPPEHAQKLIQLGLIYKLPGFLRITGAGWTRLATGS